MAHVQLMLRNADVMNVRKHNPYTMLNIDERSVMAQAQVQAVLAKKDMTYCLCCKLRFNSDDTRLNVYHENTILGAIHEYCYDVLFTEPASEPTPQVTEEVTA